MPEVTKNGNPRGTITRAQIGKIFVMSVHAKHSIDAVNARCMQRFGKRLSGLSTEEASIIIDAYTRPPNIRT